ncbi:MAG: hypothetical protein NC311_09960 [Muribaculaceae bacterium]|nr:hypothetical protein [Muribaculaceae bacterium]
MITSDGIVSSPSIDFIADVSTVLGAANGDCVYLCSNEHGQINPASRRKPIRHPDHRELSDSDFRGSTEDKANGIYFGVRLTTVGNRSFTDLHSAAVEYFPPRPGVDWCRITDFNGYHHLAKFNPEGSMDPFTYDSAVSMPVSIYFSESNKTGVSIDEIIPDTDATRLRDYYPCVLLSEGSGAYASAWARALSTAEDSYSPARLHNGSAYISRWYIPLKNLDSNPRGDSGSAKTIAELLATRLFTVTLFFVRGITAAAFGSDLSKWTDVGGDRLTLAQGIVCPRAAGMKLEIRPAAGPSGVEVIGVSLIGKATLVALAWVNPTPGRTYRVELSVISYRDGSTPVNASADITAPPDWESRMPSMSVPQQVADFLPGTYGFSWTTTRTDTAQRTASGSGAVTVR